MNAVPMRATLASVLAAAAALTCASCETATSSWAAPGEEAAPATAGLAAESGDQFGRRAEVTKTAADEAEATEGEADRLMVYRGMVAVEVARVEDAIARFVARAQEWGGYLSARQDNQVTVRVPAARFQDAMAELRGMGRVLGESMQAEDVTKQHMDLSIRLENARKARDRLLELLGKADKVEDILKIEEQLRRLTEEIERMEGELKWLKDQVAMSTVTGTFRAMAETRPDRRRQPSRFDWINQVGLENLRRQF